MDETGEAKYDRLMRDMMQIELEVNYKLIPDVARNSENTKVFSKEEKLVDIVENAKYNKQKSRSLLQAISKDTKATAEGEVDPPPNVCLI